MLIAVGLLLGLSACGQVAEEKWQSVESPDGKYSADLYIAEEGLLGSTRVRLELVTIDGGSRRTVFEGDNGWVGNPVWLNPSTLLLPFCFGEIGSVASVIAADTGYKVRFRSNSSSNIRLHVITSPDTAVEGVTYCSSTETMR